MFGICDIEKVIYNVGIYARLSREDENSQQSESIQNQKKYLADYVMNKGWKLVDIYADDGFTGTNFDRPEFKRMLEDINKRKINLIAVKDLSRLGRDYIETGFYLEKYFPEHNIRFIAVNDGIDTFSNDSNNDMNPFRSVINDMYARDISRKVHTVMDMKRKSGEFIGAFAPYGYKKSYENKNNLVVDEFAAPVVKRIFNLYLSGCGISKVANILNSEGIMSPGLYKKKNNERYYNPKIKNNLWTAETVRSILTNPTYAGNITQNKYKKINYKIKKLRKIDPEAWITVENTHEPLVSEEGFDQVQNLIKKKTATEYKKDDEQHILSGILFCGDCGERMTFTKTNKGEFYCICSGYKRFKSCTRHSYKEKEIEECIKNDLKYISRDKLDIESIIEAGKSANSYNNNYNKMVKQYEDRLFLVKKAIRQLYDDRVKGIISEEDFIDILNNYSCEKEQINGMLRNLKSEKYEEENANSNEVIEKIVSFDELDRTMILQLVDRVLIYSDRRICIYYKFFN